MHLYKIIACFTIFLIVILLQNVIHEYAHVMVAKLKGVKVIKIQWFTYSKLVFGTRVFFEKEPNFDEDNIEKKWGWIAAAGYISTTGIGYIVTIIYFLYFKYMSSWVILVSCLLSMVFLTFDPLYFTLGSIFDFGDIIGFRKAFKIEKSVSILFSLLVLTLNILLIRLVWYSSY